MMKLYDHPDCPFCHKVRVVLAEKELEHEKLFVDLRAGEQRNPEFLKLNPYGKVPVLVDEDLVVYDSTIINEYLEDEYPLPHLLPEDSAGRARVRMLEDYCDNSFLPVAGLVLAEMAKPEAERDAEKLKRYQGEVSRALVRVEGLLDGKEYLVGEFSLADIAFVPRVLVLPQLGVELDARLRQVAAWIQRLRQRPSIQALGL
ncbi:MAG: glutathione S-transferase family protein [Deltaproteobacteria bacterium]|nr:glutathione S-transferase family protein [Deltaproteobacteria bacterium]